MRRATSFTSCSKTEFCDEKKKDSENTVNLPIFLSQEQELEIVKELPHPTLEDVKEREIYLGEKTKKYTLFLDLDETLVYSRGSLVPKTSLQDSRLEVVIRPYVNDLLKIAGKHYELVVFSAGNKEYVEKVVNIIDPDNKYIKWALSRESCIEVTKGHFVKDLRIIKDRSIDEMLIVDNSVISFANNIENGIYIIPYFGEEDDKELGYLNTYLMDLYEKDNIVKINGKNMGLLK